MNLSCTSDACPCSNHSYLLFPCDGNEHVRSHRPSHRRLIRSWLWPCIVCQCSAINLIKMLHLIWNQSLLSEWCPSTAISVKYQLHQQGTAWVCETIKDCGEGFLWGTSSSKWSAEAPFNCRSTAPHVNKTLV